MSKILALLLLSALAACSKAPEAPVPAHASEVDWVKPAGADVDAIFALARAQDKPVFLYWGAVWCPPCNQIKATVFNRQDFIERSRLFIPVYVDGDTAGAQKLGARFKVRGYPTMILFKPDGSELTRLPGEVEAARYLDLLSLGLASGSSVKASLAAALGAAPAQLKPQDWRLLAYYAWDQDEAPLLSHEERAATLQRLAQACPEDQREAATRLKLRALAAAVQDKNALTDASASRHWVHGVLADPVLARAGFDLLLNYGSDLVPALSAPGSAERAVLLAAWTGALERFASDATLSRGDRLSVVSTQLALAKLDLPKDAKPALDAALLAQVRHAARAAELGSTSPYERQALVPNAADLLSEAGLIDESDALLKSELPKAISPYYHMLVLASNARARGDKAGALDWSEKAWIASVGPATRLQWGSGYVNRLIELAPLDSARIEKAAAGVLAEVDPVAETFYERNRRSLEKMGRSLQAWNAQGRHAATLKKLSAQLDTVCAKLPEGDEARAACAGVFKPPSMGPKA